jgi:hypothetical protein
MKIKKSQGKLKVEQLRQEKLQFIKGGYGSTPPPDPPPPPPTYQEIQYTEPIGNTLHTG